MPDLEPALQGALRRTAPPAEARPGLLVLGAGGTLGAAVLEAALASGSFTPVMALVREPLATTVRGLVPLRWDAPQLPVADLPPSLPPNLPPTALIVFERERHSNGRDDAFTRAEPEALLPWARALKGGGVRRLVVVVPHAPAMLPKALEGGFAGDDERTLAGLGFEQVVILRPAQLAGAGSGGVSRLQRFAAWWLTQLRWMVPAGEQALRTPRLALLVIELVRLLPRAPSATRVLPQEVLSAASASPDPAARLAEWLQGARDNAPR